MAIRELTELGSQPKHSVSGRHVLVYNWEIYELEELRRRLNHEGYPLRGGSDTEVLLGMIEVFGGEETLRSIDWMFAFCVIDLERSTMTLARDRSEEKPLYWLSGDGLLNLLLNCQRFACCWPGGRQLTLLR